MPGSSTTRTNRLNPYLTDDTYERLNALRFRRKTMKWEGLLAWAVGVLEKECNRVEKMGPRKRR